MEQRSKQRKGRPEQAAQALRELALFLLILNNFFESNKNKITKGNNREIQGKILNGLYHNRTLLRILETLANILVCYNVCTSTPRPPPPHRGR
jgi:hypothetical protein